MKVLVINRSPRAKGNSDLLCDEFIRGAEEAGNQVEKISLREKEIFPCKACYACFRTGSCVQKDDMAQIYPAVKECDVVVLASPLYYWTMSGQLRTALDRLFALEEGDGNLLRGNGKSSALLMAAEGHGFDDAVLYYDHLLEHLRWKNLGHVLAGGNMEVGDIKGKTEIEQAYALGKSIQ